jgi:predicted DNA-binding transcriptional regulator AlpA
VSLHEAFPVIGLLKTSAPRGLDIDQLRTKLGGEKPLDKSTIWRHVRDDVDFPKPYYVLGNSPRWVEPEVDTYIERRIAARNDPAYAAAQQERVQRREERAKKPRAEAQERAREVKARASRRRSRNKLQMPNTS